MLETLVHYDYPQTTGIGLYRNDRFVTPFSLKGQVEKAFKQLLCLVSRLGADLVLSYPSDGLLHRAGHDLYSMLRSSFRRVDIPVQLPYLHSTFGASKGASTSRVVENVYLARN